MKDINLHTYTIHFDDVEAQLAALLERTDFSTIFVLTDENTRAYCLPYLLTTLPEDTYYINIQSGEVNKNIETCQIIWQSLLEQGADRLSLLINLGGGVIGDMGGFCASTYMRGIRFVQIPTTLLSQVDASVGSKLGIDFQQVKNIIGLFNDPLAVLIDPVFLTTLSRAELRSGFAETIKHALIYDADLWTGIQQITDVNAVADWADIIYRSVQIKRAVVQADRKEQGVRKILNFGHTIGHALESHFLTTDTPLLHGEAIAWGMYAEAHISHQQGSLDKNALDDIQAYLTKVYSDCRPSLWPLQSLLEYMRKDKKNKNQRISFSLLDGIGTCTPDQFMDEDLLSGMITELVA